VNAIASIANELVTHRDVLALPRWRVVADVRERFRCCDSTAREAYALARTAAHARKRRDTVTYARVERGIA
jgi:hypothetical protein